jgi:hypothetical protein
MSLDKPTIFKNKVLKPSEDYDFLMEKGIEFVQKFSKEIWTDYNLHDPGVTILEQICYGLTDLAYKTSFPIEDLLAEKGTGTIDFAKNSFFSPATVFSSHPITTIDFRKLLIDSFPEIQNCWVYPLRRQGAEEGLNGIYHTEIMPSLAFQKEVVKNPDLVGVFLKRVSDFLKVNRNIGEDFNDPVLLRPQKTPIQGVVEIAPDTDSDRVMAEVIFALEVYLYHPVAYASFAELMEKGYAVEDIFSGPLLEGGFILDGQLKDRSSLLSVDKLQGLISKIAGVKRCHALTIGTELHSKTFQLPPMTYAAINRDVTDPDNIFNRLRITVNGNKQRLSINRVEDFLLELWSKNYRVYLQDIFKNNFWKQNIRSKYRNPADYLSIQYHFPKIYGLSKEGLSAHESPERHAKVKQLKGYLMLFEKHMVNYLAQLAHVSDFFDADIANHQQTYFHQSFETNLGKVQLEKELSNEFQSDGVNPATGESRLLWLQRKNRMLDHLLARFGEELNDLPFYIALKLNLLTTEEDMLAYELQYKANYLRSLPELTYAKHRVNCSIGQWEGVATLEITMCLALGINPRKGSLLPTFVTVAPVEERTSEHPSFVKSQLTFSELKERFRPLFLNDMDYRKAGDDEGSPVSFGKIGIKQLFQRTIQPESYWISKTVNKDGMFEVLFQKSPSNWVYIWEGKGLDNAKTFLVQTIQRFRDMNKKSEGFYLIDHLSLRELLETPKAGFFLTDQTGQRSFQSIWVDSVEDRQELLRQFYEASMEPDSYKMIGNQVFILGKNQEKICSKTFTGSINLQEIYEETAEFAFMMASGSEFAGLLSLYEVEKLRFKESADNQKKQRTLILTRQAEDGKEIREDFFDLKASMLFPDWPARFQNSHFTSFVENEVNQRIPAHLHLYLHWVDVANFEKIEKSFYEWEAHKNQPSKALRRTHAYQLYSDLSQLMSTLHAK